MPIPMENAFVLQGKVVSADNIPKTLLCWTPQAVACYRRNCQCRGCLINETLETKCRLKFIIPKILEKQGEPNV